MIRFFFIAWVACASSAAAQRTVLADFNLVIGGPMARSGAGVTQSLWGDSSATVRWFAGRVWRDTLLVDTLSALLQQRLSAHLGTAVILAPRKGNPATVRPMTANPSWGRDEMLRRKNRIGALPDLLLKQALADPQLRPDRVIIIDCRIDRDVQGDGAGKLTDRAARERAVVSLVIEVYDRTERRLTRAAVEGVTNDRWKYYQRIMGLRQQDTSLTGREIADLVQLAFDKALPKLKLR